MSTLLTSFTAQLDYDGEFYRMGFIVVPESHLESIPDYTKRPRLRCSLEGLPPYPCALHSFSGGYRILINNKTMRTQGWINDQPLSVELFEETSEYGMEMPEVWEAVIMQDEDAEKAFERLTPGKKRSIFHMVNQAKREQTKVDRALLIARNIKAGAWDPKDFARKSYTESI